MRCPTYIDRKEESSQLTSDHARKKNKKCNRKRIKRENLKIKDMELFLRDQQDVQLFNRVISGKLVKRESHALRPSIFICVYIENWACANHGIFHKKSPL